MKCLRGEGGAVDGIYLGFARDFEFVNHKFVSASIKFFHLGDVVVRWIKTHRSRRASRAEFAGELSKTIPMRSYTSDIFPNIVKIKRAYNRFARKFLRTNYWNHSNEHILLDALSMLSIGIFISYGICPFFPHPERTE